MTTTPKVPRYNTRPVDRSAVPQDAGNSGGQLFDTHDDGFGNLDFRRPEDQAASRAEAPEPTPAPMPAPPVEATSPEPSAERITRAVTPEEIARVNAAILTEGLTERQLRRAMLVAQRSHLSPTSEADAVRLLREAGVDPFSRASILRVVTPSPEAAAPDAASDTAAPGAHPQRGFPPQTEAREPGREIARLPGDVVQLPKKAKPIALPSTEQRAEVNQAAEILRMQQDIARRRRRRLALLGARLFAFVLLPTILAGWYFYMMATPMYSVRSEFVIQQAGPSGGGGSMGGLFSGTAFATSQDSIAVQGYLQSREAMGRLDEDLGFRSHFQSPEIDQLQRMAPDAGLEAAYKVYKKFLKISFDTTEGVIRMDVAAADPMVAAAWSRQLIAYAEEQVDHLTQRLRADQMNDAQAGYEAAQKALTDSQRKLIELQEKFKILSSETEVGLIVGQISGLENQLTQERLALAQMESNAEPNQARMDPIKRRIATLEGEVADLRARMTETSAGSTSLAEIQGQLLVAQADLQTRQLLLAQALQSMETSRVEANRQVRYLSLSVSPIPPDEPAFPRAFENTLVTLLIMLGIYLMVSMTAAILREQVSS
ncbi:MAG: capsule biosynthesis protein [Tabrizicola sp.]|uniref:capsule biosynthesis protein n=1 Tax=Tabrizicola sp. TaxID=2005166 RepID=UPI002ABB1EF6|nr:capsule biosynthesis protein [Tabrizicola sp.]MDZ4086497.1 capsule biosynthesis protein [Tabrizicola sp.]